MDSQAFHWRAWQEAMAADGTPVTEAQFLASFGQRNDAILRVWLGDGAAAERIRRVGDDKEAVYRRLVAEEGTAALPGAAEWVRRLHAEGWRQAIASSAPRANVEVVVRVLGLERYFGASVAAEDVRHGKPAPDVFLAAAGRLAVPAERCIVVEDAEQGIEASYPLALREGECLVLDWEPLFREVLREREARAPLGVICAKFHNTLAEAIVAVARRVGVERVALSGGVFQNRYLTERAFRLLENAGFRPFTHQRVPPNDGGIALGQIVIAAARMDGKCV